MTALLLYLIIMFWEATNRNLSSYSAFNECLSDMNTFHVEENSNTVLNCLTSYKNKQVVIIVE